MDTPIRIAFLSEHASPVALLGGADAGGQNVYVDEVSRNLALRGYTVDVFTRRDHPETPEIVEWAPGVRVINIKAGPLVPRPKDELWPYMEEFRDSFLDFMHRDHVQYHLLHGNFWMSGWVATELGRRLDIPVVQIFHATGKTKQRHQKKADTSPGDRIKTELEVVQKADRLIAQCPSEREELIKDYYAHPNKVVTIPSAVNIKVFRPEEQLAARAMAGIDPAAFVIVYVGRMLPRKDVRNVVRGLAHMLNTYDCSQRDVRLLVVGGETVDPDPVATPEMGEVMQLARELGVIDRIHFTGKRQQDTLRYYYSAGDVAVTTPWYEPFGLTPLEGMACGKPVIGSAVGGITFTIADGETGYLVPPRDPATLAEKLYRLYCDPTLVAQMGQAARMRVEQEFTWPVVALRTASLYNSLLTDGILSPLAGSAPLNSFYDGSPSTGIE